MKTKTTAQELKKGIVKVIALSSLLFLFICNNAFADTYTWTDYIKDGQYWDDAYAVGWWGIDGPERYTDKWSLDFNFTGQGIRVYARKGYNQGQVDIYIDNVYDTTISQYYDGILWGQKVYEKTGLSSGTHNIKVYKVDGQYMYHYKFQTGQIVDTIAPAMPTGLIATAGDGEVVLDWNSNTEPDISYYNVYRSITADGTYTKITTSEVTASNYTDASVTNGTTYYYKVTAVDNVGNESPQSTCVSATPQQNISAPMAPTGLGGLSGNQSVTLTWNEKTDYGLAGYNVYRADSNNQTYIKINSEIVTTAGYIDSGLMNGQQYWYKVTELNINNEESPMSLAVGVTPFSQETTSTTSTGVGFGMNTNLLLALSLGLIVTGYVTVSRKRFSYR